MQLAMVGQQTLISKHLSILALRRIFQHLLWDNGRLAGVGLTRLASAAWLIV